MRALLTQEKQDDTVRTLDVDTVRTLSDVITSIEEEKRKVVFTMGKAASGRRLLQLPLRWDWQQEVITFI